MQTLKQVQRTLAENLRVARARLQISQEQLALDAGVDRTFISQIERQIGNPSLKTLSLIAKALKTEIVELLLPPPTRSR